MGKRFLVTAIYTPLFSTFGFEPKGKVLGLVCERFHAGGVNGGDCHSGDHHRTPVTGVGWSG